MNRIERLSKGSQLAKMHQQVEVGNGLASIDWHSGSDGEVTAGGQWISGRKVESQRSGAKLEPLTAAKQAALRRT